MKKIFLYNHGGSGNHGCEALVRTAALVIKETAEEIGQSISLELQSEVPEEDEQYGIGKSIGIDQLTPALCPVRKADLQYLHAYWDLKVRHDYISMDVLPYLETIKNTQEGALGISIGGDNYCYSYYPKFIRMHQKIAKKCPTVLLGCSLEPELFNDRSMLEDLRSYRLISARESVTFAMLQNAGMTNIIYAPDSAFLLEPEYMPLPTGFQEGNTIGINLSPLVVRREATAGTVMDNYRELIRFILEQTDCSIALIPHVVQNGNDDRTVLQKFYREFENTGRIIMIPDCDCRKLKGYIARCRFLIASRTHASIAAYSSGVPTLVMGYSVKASGLARDLFGSEESYVIPVSELNNTEQLKKSFIQLFDKEAEIRNSLKTRLPQYLAAFKNLEERMAQLILGNKAWS